MYNTVVNTFVSPHEKSIMKPRRALREQIFFCFAPTCVEVLISRRDPRVLKSCRVLRSLGSGNGMELYLTTLHRDSKSNFDFYHLLLGWEPSC